MECQNVQNVLWNFLAWECNQKSSSSSTFRGLQIAITHVRFRSFHATICIRLDVVPGGVLRVPPYPPFTWRGSAPLHLAQKLLLGFSGFAGNIFVRAVHKRECLEAYSDRNLWGNIQIESCCHGKNEIDRCWSMMGVGLSSSHKGFVGPRGLQSTVTTHRSNLYYLLTS